MYYVYSNVNITILLIFILLKLSFFYFSMTNISHHKIADSTYQKMKQYFSRILTSNTTARTEDILEDLLTPSESIMLTKRFGAICMFSQRKTPYAVSIALGLSLPTTSRLHKQYQAGEFEALLQTIRPKQKNEFLLLLSDFVFSKASYTARRNLQKRAGL